MSIPSAIEQRASAMFAYHDATKHTPERLRASRHFLDWGNMPDPFRHYEGAPLVDLPAHPAPPSADALSILLGAECSEPERDPLLLLSQLLFYSASISATKVSPSGSRYALRVNPSSGNLHPTEFHVLARGMEGLPDGAYHYRASSHMLEQYGRGDFFPQLAAAGLGPLPETGIVVLLASILWREAWKYQSRAYRYCLHDIGHAWQSVALCGAAVGVRFLALGDFGDSEIKRLLDLDDEEPMLALVAELSSIVASRANRTEETPPALLRVTKNALSESRVSYPLIDEIHLATSARVRVDGFPGAGLRQALPARAASGTELVRCGEAFASVVRRRRSALNFEGGERQISSAQLSSLLQAAERSLDADFLGGIGPPSALLELWLYIHRVEGYSPGLYRLALPSLNLELQSAGDQQVMAAALSLQQDLAANACVAFSIVGNFAEAARQFGNRGYRYLHFLAGAVGQKLYLASHAMSFGATGIGAFFDDYVHSHLGIDGRARQVIYHFACGYPIPDPRLSEE